MERHIIGENGIGYTLREDGLYYPDLQIPEGTLQEFWQKMKLEFLQFQPLIQTIS